MAREIAYALDGPLARETMEVEILSSASMFSASNRLQTDF
jgi:hypothetical protein